MAPAPHPESANGRPKAAGFVQADQLYTLREFARRLGLGERALKTVRRRGLPVHRVGRAYYVIGDEAIAWLRNMEGKKKPRAE